MEKITYIGKSVTKVFLLHFSKFLEKYPEINIKAGI